jgi:RpiB/LacA/LacB family sugar-phosphate isomerase
MMRVAISSDHAGFSIKDEVINFVQESGHDVIDLGTYDQTPVDYPDFVLKVARAILEKQADRGIVVCGSGVGACIAANKVDGIYAAICHDTYSAHQGVEHDNVNVLCLGGRIIGLELAREIVNAFLGAEFSAEERHLRRFKKVLAIEKKHLPTE